MGHEVDHGYSVHACDRFMYWRMHVCIALPTLASEQDEQKRSLLDRCLRRRQNCRSASLIGNIHYTASIHLSIDPAWNGCRAAHLESCRVRIPLSSLPPSEGRRFGKGRCTVSKKEKGTVPQWRRNSVCMDTARGPLSSLRFETVCSVVIQLADVRT